MTSPRRHLAAAVRRLNAEYGRLPDPDAVPIFSADVLKLEREVEIAMKSGDDHAALRAIDRWRDRHLEQFEEARR